MSWYIAMVLVRAWLATLAGTLRLILPQLLARGAVQRLHHRPGLHHVHHAVVDDGDAFGVPRAHAARPGHAELAHVLLVDLLERAEALRVIGAAVHQPVVGTGVQQHFLGDGLIVLNLREGGCSKCESGEKVRFHGWHYIIVSK